MTSDSYINNWNGDSV